MKLTEAIQRYRMQGDDGILDRIRQRMNLDDLAYRRRTQAAYDPWAAVALRCLRLLAPPLSAAMAELARHGFDPERERPDRVFGEYAQPILERTGIALTPDNYERHADELRRYLGAAYPPLFAAYQRLIGVRPTIQQLAASRIVHDHWPALEQAAREGLDALAPAAFENDRAAVRALSKAIRAKFGSMRGERAHAPLSGAEAIGVPPVYYGAVYAIFGVAAVSPDGLSRAQNRMIAAIADIVEEDAAERHFEEYDIDEQGGYRIRTRYLARRLGVDEERLKRSLAAARRAAYAFVRESD